MPHVFSVIELTSAIKDVLEIQFPFIWVKGQVSNISRPGSGHIYFTLKDEQAGLQVVWFKNSQAFSRQKGADPASNLVDGQEVVCAGKIGLYAPRGAYQLVAELVQEQGFGDLFLAFEALKSKLKGLEYFEEDRKRPIPYCPDRVGIVTTPTGAVIHDFMEVARGLGLGSEIRVYPSQVQGDDAPRELVRAIKLANEQAWAQVLVIIRGGGSLEDLWAFNDEKVARAVFESEIPVLTGIGHETDTTIADLTADQRAATPSHAAQTLWPGTDDLAQDVDRLETALGRSYDNYLKHQVSRLDHLEKALTWLSPAGQLQRLDEKLEVLKRDLHRSGAGFWQIRAEKLQALESRLQVRFGSEYWQVRSNQLDYLEKRIINSARIFLDRNHNRVSLAGQKLAGLDPRGPLKRGYAMVTIEQTGSLLRSPGDVRSGDGLIIEVAHGNIRARTIDSD
ncbi:exodeoxyribonuclease VII large subunit [Desulfonatronovibrio hydrogenovorans]|uniref:exodeoxyribonuclease VII large subunit n=1 Tax=Desulfonatronovibrio hydrogenovorans TaxID=53245 RepID=UPI00048E33B7|nr:exodeoxyribonuclease VII large subunit [Desulfonatronovibrio hydrogenovorans]